MPRILFCARAIADMVVKGKSIEGTSVPSPYRTSQGRLNNPQNFVRSGLS